MKTGLIELRFVYHRNNKYIYYKCIKSHFFHRMSVSIMNTQNLILYQHFFMEMLFFFFSEVKFASLCIFCVLLLALYISPLFINSPCVIEKRNLPPRPKMLAHRGASSVSIYSVLFSYFCYKQMFIIFEFISRYVLNMTEDDLFYASFFLFYIYLCGTCQVFSTLLKVGGST